MVTSSNQQSDLYAFALHHSALSASVNTWNNKQENKMVLELKWLQDMLNNVTTAIATIYFLICVQLCCNVFWKVHQNYLLNFNIVKILCGTAKKKLHFGGLSQVEVMMSQVLVMSQVWRWCHNVLVMMSQCLGDDGTSSRELCNLSPLVLLLLTCFPNNHLQEIDLRGHLKVNRSSLFVKPTPL